MRHQLSDKIQKLERELESSEREMTKVVEDAKEKDVGREKMRDDYERKVKQYESQVFRESSNKVSQPDCEAQDKA